MTVVEFYNHAIKNMPPAERLRLAALILNDIAPNVVHSSDEWTDEDLADFSQSGWRQIESGLGEPDDA